MPPSKTKKLKSKSKTNKSASPNRRSIPNFELGEKRRERQKQKKHAIFLKQLQPSHVNRFLEEHEVSIVNRPSLCNLSPDDYTHFEKILKNISTNELLKNVYFQLVHNMYENTVPVKALLHVLKMRNMLVSDHILGQPTNEDYIFLIIEHYDENPTIYSTDPVLYESYNIFETIAKHQLNAANRD